MATSNVMGAGGIAPAMASSLPIGSTLPHFTQGNELQKLLSDERKRSEQHKKNYQQLKVEHSKWVTITYIVSVKIVCLVLRC